MAGTTARTRKTPATTKTTTEDHAAEAPVAEENAPPAETTPAPAETTPAPAETTPAPEETTPAAEATALANDDAPKAPDAAPLEPPTTHEPPAAPVERGYVTPTEVIPDEDNLAEVIIDDATGEPPADVDAVFQPITEYGSVLTCTVRLVEKTFLGPHSTPVHRLLQPAGATVSESVAARIRERLQDQAARIAAQTAATTEQ